MSQFVLCGFVQVLNAGNDETLDALMPLSAIWVAGVVMVVACIAALGHEFVGHF